MSIATCVACIIKYVNSNQIYLTQGLTTHCTQSIMNKYAPVIHPVHSCCGCDDALHCPTAPLVSLQPRCVVHDESKVTLAGSQGDGTYADDCRLLAKRPKEHNWLRAQSGVEKPDLPLLHHLSRVSVFSGAPLKSQE